MDKLENLYNYYIPSMSEDFSFYGGGEKRRENGNTFRRRKSEPISFMDVYNVDIEKNKEKVILRIFYCIYMYVNML